MTKSLSENTKNYIFEWNISPYPIELKQMALLFIFVISILCQPLLLSKMTENQQEIVELLFVNIFF